MNECVAQTNVGVAGRHYALGREVQRRWHPATRCRCRHRSQRLGALCVCVEVQLPADLRVHKARVPRRSAGPQHSVRDRLFLRSFVPSFLRAAQRVTLTFARQRSADNPEKLKGKIEWLRNELNDREKFREYYTWLFSYAKDNHARHIGTRHAALNAADSSSVSCRRSIPLTGFTPLMSHSRLSLSSQTNPLPFRSGRWCSRVDSDTSRNGRPSSRRRTTSPSAGMRGRSCWRL